MNEQPAQKKEWHTPVLTKHGTVQEITHLPPVTKTPGSFDGIILAPDIELWSA